MPLLNQEWPYPHPRPCLPTTRWSSLDPRRMAKVRRNFRLFYPGLFEVPLGEATDYPFLRLAEESKLCLRLQDVVDRPPLAVGMAREAGLEYDPG